MASSSAKWRSRSQNAVAISGWLAVAILVLASTAAATTATEPVLGIDLGTTMSVVAHLHNGNVEVLENEGGHRGTPSVVSVTDRGEVLVGDAASNNRIRNPEHTFNSIKRIIGRKFEHPDVTKQAQAVAYEIVNCDTRWGVSNIAPLFGNVVSHVHWLFGRNDVNGRPAANIPDEVKWRRNDGSACISIPTKGKATAYPVEMVSALVLSHLRSNAERKLGQNVTKAVISVPAYFTENQRAATLDAARIAGLQVLRLLPEPTAAALAFGLKIPDFLSEQERKILVFDLGGGTFDVSILSFSKGVFNVLAIDGDNRCGGDDIDLILANYFAKEFSKQFPRSARGLSASRVKARLLKQAELTKKELSFRPTSNVFVEGLVDGNDLAMTMTRARMEEECRPFFDRILPVVHRALGSIKLTARDIDSVLMVGGSSRIPKVNEMLNVLFDKPLVFAVNPDEAVAVGAAVLAFRMVNPTEDILAPTGEIRIPGGLSLIDMAKQWWYGAETPTAPEDDVAPPKNDQSQDLSPDRVVTVSERARSVDLVDAAPHSLGNEIQHNRNFFMIKRHSPLPCTYTTTFTTIYDYQESVTFTIREGESEVANENVELGSFTLTGIEIAKKNVPVFRTTFTLDNNGVLTVDVFDEKTQAKASKVLQNLSWGRLQDDELHLMQGVALRLLHQTGSEHDEV